MNEIRTNPSSNAALARFDDEIDLVDLFLSIWKRKWLVLVVALVVFGLAGVYAVQSEEPADAKTVTTIVEVPSLTLAGGRDNTSVDLISVEALKELTERVFVPETKSSLGMEAGIFFESPEDTKLLVIRSQASKASISDVTDFHKALVERIEDRLATRAERFRSSGEAAGRGVAEVFGGGVMDLARVKPTPAVNGPSTALILSLGAIFGLFAGLFAALMANFIAVARERLQAERADQNNKTNEPSDA